MTLDEAYALHSDKRRWDERHREKQPAPVTITRNGASWTGIPVAVIPSPAIVLDVDGERVPIVLDGAALGEIQQTEEDR